MKRAALLDKTASKDTCPSGQVGGLILGLVTCVTRSQRPDPDFAGVSPAVVVGRSECHNLVSRKKRRAPPFAGVPRADGLKLLHFLSGESHGATRQLDRETGSGRGRPGRQPQPVADAFGSA